MLVWLGPHHTHTLITPMDFRHFINLYREAFRRDGSKNLITTPKQLTLIDAFTSDVEVKSTIDMLLMIKDIPKDPHTAHAIALAAYTRLCQLMVASGSSSLYQGMDLIEARAHLEQ